MGNSTFIPTPICNIRITEENSFITKIQFIKKTRNIKEFTVNETPILTEAKLQLNEYFLKKRKFFNLPIKANGTAFQTKVWQALIQIPYGETRTYKQIAEIVGSPKAYRAVGNANNKNPIPIVIPCHRVIGIGNNLVGYAGGIEIKKFLLNIEQTI